MRVQINDILIFDEDTMSFSPINSILPTVKLGSIHTRCFSCLCRQRINNESVVSKKELFYEGWEKHGLVSSDNSLAQTIFQIRKALRPFNLADTIGTIPRVGFSLRKVKIEPVNPHALAEWSKSKKNQFFRLFLFFSPKKLPLVSLGLQKEKKEQAMTAYLPYWVSFLTLLLVSSKYLLTSSSSS